MLLTASSSELSLYQIRSLSALAPEARQKQNSSCCQLTPEARQQQKTAPVKQTGGYSCFIHNTPGSLHDSQIFPKIVEQMNNIFISS